MKNNNIELSAEVAELEKEINCDINQLFKK